MESVINKDPSKETLMVFEVQKAALKSKLVEMRFDVMDESHDYLLDTKAWQFTTDEVEKLKLALAKSIEDASVLSNTSTATMWGRELDALEPFI